MSLLKALDECEQETDQGWSTAGRFGHDTTTPQTQSNQNRNETCIVSPRKSLSSQEDDVVCLTPPPPSDMSDTSDTPPCLSDQHRDPSSFDPNSFQKIPKTPKHSTKKPRQSAISNAGNVLHFMTPDGRHIYHRTPPSTASASCSKIVKKNIEQVSKLSLRDLQRMVSDSNQRQNSERTSPTSGFLTSDLRTSVIGKVESQEFKDSHQNCDMSAMQSMPMLTGAPESNGKTCSAVAARGQAIVPDVEATLNDRLHTGEVPIESDTASRVQAEEIITSSTSSENEIVAIPVTTDVNFSERVEQNNESEMKEVILSKPFRSGSQVVAKVVLEGKTQYVALKENPETPSHTLLLEDKEGNGTCSCRRGILSPEVPQTEVNAKDCLTGGGKKGKSCVLKGNATGLNMVSRDGSTSCTSDRSCGTSKTDGLVDSREWAYADAKHRPLERPPLHGRDDEKMDEADTTEQMDERSDSDTNDGAITLELHRETPVKKPKVNQQTQPFVVVVCDNCGNLNNSLTWCQCCNRPLPENPKFHRGSAPLPAKANNDNTEVKRTEKRKGRSVINKTSFYGNKLAEHSKVYDNLNVEESQPKRKVIRSTKAGGRRNIKRFFTPETVTISSSDEDDNHEEEMTDTSKTTSEIQLASSPAVPSPPAVKEETLSMPRVGDSPSPSPKLEASPQPAPPPVSRRYRMQDQHGKVVLPSTKAKTTRRTTVKKKSTEVDVPSRIMLDARGVRIGTLKGSPYKPVVLTTDSVSIACETQDATVEMIIRHDEIVGCEGYLGCNMPVLFLHVTPACAARIRDQCHMTSSDDELYFDPSSKVDKFQKLVILLSSMNTKLSAQVSAAFIQMEKNRKLSNGDDSLYTEISFSHANSILMSILSKKADSGSSSSTSPIVSPVCTPAIRTRSVKTIQSVVPMETDALPDLPEDRPIFTGPVEKLITFPPPPAAGAITVTNEDLFCLNEGEFLNDVIIDFYLKYLVHEILSPEDKQKTHIFNSFFYKRLTQRPARQSSLADDNTLPLQLKRHNRVKTWTRHVDIFSKDFVIVPINENAHWFLAIICFPALKEPQYLPGCSPASAQGKQLTLCRQKQSCIIVMDSLAGPSRINVIKVLRDYLQVEWDVKKKETEGAKEFNRLTVRGTSIKVPQQTNYSDCGVFVLHYVEIFFKDPIKDYTFPLSMEDWFPVEDVQQKREDIRQIVMDLSTKQASLNS